MNRRHTLIAGVLAVAVAGLGAVQLLPGAAPEARAAGLTSYRGCADLLDYYRTELGRSVTRYGFGWGGPMVLADSATAPSAAAGSASRESADAGSVGSGPTGTNLQEQGVDEPDLAKLRDGRLLVLTGSRLRVLSATAEPRLLGSLDLHAASGQQLGWGGELLLVGDRALVVVPGWRQDVRAVPDGTGIDGDRRGIAPFLPGTPTTELVLLDLTSDQPAVLERAVYDAQYVSARLVDGTVRLVTTTRPQVPVLYPAGPGRTSTREALDANRRAASAVELDAVLPQVVRRDAGGAVLERGPAVACDHTFHAGSPAGASTLLVTTLRPGDGLAATDSTAVTSDGDLVYAAADRLYVATSRWGTVGPVRDLAARPDEVTTELHAFDTSSPTSTSYVGSGGVPGYLMGRWALSSYEGNLRVATTRQPPWDGTTSGPTSSMVVVLAERDGGLVETGRAEGLGKTEQIRAVRYFGDLAAVVTFRQTDPLYLLDLSGTPRVLGQLKVPGFSTYLHPLGDGLLLGLGQDATQDGQVTGMQVSVFDISDPAQPTLRDRLDLGYGWSPALDDSRAFGYDPQRRLATFAFTGYDPEGMGGQQSSALGVSVGTDGTLRLAGRLDLADDTWPQRVLTDPDRVYAVADTGVVAGDAATMARTGELRFSTG